MNRPWSLHTRTLFPELARGTDRRFYSATERSPGEQVRSRDRLAGIRSRTVPEVSGAAFGSAMNDALWIGLLRGGGASAHSRNHVIRGSPPHQERRAVAATFTESAATVYVGSAITTAKVSLPPLLILTRESSNC